MSANDELYNPNDDAETIANALFNAEEKSKKIEKKMMGDSVDDYKRMISVIQSMKPKLYRKGTRKLAHTFINEFSMEQWQELETEKVKVFKDAVNHCNEVYNEMMQTAIEQQGFKLRKDIEAEMISKTPDMPKQDARRESAQLYRAQITKEMKKAMTARSKARHALQTAEYHFALSYLLDQNSDEGRKFQAAHQKMSKACRDVHAMIVEYELNRLPDDGKKANKQKELNNIPNNFEKRFATSTDTRSRSVGRRTSAARPSQTRTDARPGWMNNLGM